MTLPSAITPSQEGQQPSASTHRLFPQPLPNERLGLLVFSYPSYFCTLYSTRKPFHFGLRNPYSSVNTLAPMASSSELACPDSRLHPFTMRHSERKQAGKRL